MKNRDKLSLFSIILFVGLISITIVILISYSAELQYENNELITTNAALQGEVDTLEVKIQEANHIRNIEEVAINKLGMVRPAADDYIFITEEDEPPSNFAMIIKQDVYKR